MKKQFLNLGKTLSRDEQKNIKGGVMHGGFCETTSDCPHGECCDFEGHCVQDDETSTCIRD